MGTRASLDGCGKTRPPPGFDPWTVQTVASRYTDWAILAQALAVKQTMITISIYFVFCSASFHAESSDTTGITCVKANSKPVIENITSPKVMTKYCGISHSICILLGSVTVRSLCCWNKYKAAVKRNKLSVTVSKNHSMQRIKDWGYLKSSEENI